MNLHEVGPGNGPISVLEPVVHVLIRVSGVVQGVGFRPFIYNLAKRHGLAGTVLNDSRGVEIHAQGTREVVTAFIAAIRDEAPAAARIDELLISEHALEVFAGFRILASETTANAFTHVSPDLAICTDCRRELEDARDRRYAYPFINCTNCGPRFSIIRALPYDRPQTTMREFALCGDCRSEYENPENRRFHAQPVACEQCGPKLRLLNCRAGSWIDTAANHSAIAQAVKLLRDKHILLLKGIGGFHLACDACDDNAVNELRTRKRRDEKPFAVMFPDVESLKQACAVSDVEWRFLNSPRAPILLLKRQGTSLLSEAVAPKNPYVGAMLPYSPLHVLLLIEFGKPLVMTSANLSDEPIAFCNDDALTRMAGIADGALVHDRAIEMFADDSVVKVIGGAARVWRRSRGYVPESVHVPIPFGKQTLAFGPQMKNTFCLGKQDFALLSQHLGDLDSEHAIRAQQKALDHFLKLFDARIELLACDLHPDYTTTHLAEAWTERSGVPLVRVQHHHAHLAACLAENGQKERAIGITLDGTGFGADGSIWGGEILVGDFRSFERAAHLQETFMPGGELAAKQPWRMALAWMYEAFGEPRNWPETAWQLSLQKELSKNGIDDLLNSALQLKAFPRTTSMGRLFDAAASLTFFGMKKQHEGQAAMLFEGMMSNERQEPYPFELRSISDGLVISPVPMIRALIEDISKRVSPSVISKRFHEGLTDVLSRAAEAIRDKSGITLAALSGGCFHNTFLHESLAERLQQLGFDVITHREVPPNDGGVSLGQAVIANAQEDL
ncbi:carbamoyltransferase HypF [candidate division KSB1 bacterium]|nr:MAG: carbamoyltransferase HypF [candidate division KSB1 bacterium]